MSPSYLGYEIRSLNINRETVKTNTNKGESKETASWPKAIRSKQGLRHFNCEFHHEDIIHHPKNKWKWSIKSHLLPASLKPLTYFPANFPTTKKNRKTDRTSSIHHPNHSFQPGSSTSIRCMTRMDPSAVLLSVARLEVTIFILGASAVDLSILVT